jgi:thymidylate kinase
VLSFELSNDAQIPKVVKAQSRQIYRSRTFVCVEGTRNDGVMGHAGSGFMVERESSQTPAFEHWVTSSVAAILRKEGSLTATQPKRGLFVVLLGLDGSGKTTVARKLCCLAGQTDRFRAVRYFHWRLSLAGVPSFPLPSAENVPRKPGGRPNPLRSAASALRLFKNLLLTRLAWRWQTQKLLHDQTLVLMDRYYYNYYLDPVSVRYYGPAWLLDKGRPAYPKPDLIVVLKAPAVTLLARKQELSEPEIQRQDVLLSELALSATHSLVVDASRPAEEVARTVMEKITSLRNA